MTRRFIGVFLVAAALLLSGCTSGPKPASTSAADAEPAITATSLCADLNPLGFVEARDTVNGFEAELGVVITAEDVVSRCEEFPDETIDAAVRAVADGKAASEAEAEAAAQVLSYAWTDEDGYTFDVVIESSVIQANADIANAKPGEALINVTVSTQGTVTNTTTGRNATVTQDMRFTPVWAASSTVCKYLIPAAGAADGEWCTMGSANLTPKALFTDEATVPEGGTTVVRNLQTSPFQITVQEADAESMEAELEAPAGFILSLGSLDLSSRTCSMRDGTGTNIAASTVEVVC